MKGDIMSADAIPREKLCEMLIELETELKESKNIPRLGCSTTAELIDEIRSRCEVNGTLNYKTIQS